MTSRRLTVTEDLIRRYSRRGNYHSDPAVADELGLPGLIAQGVHVAGPAYGLLLDEWGDDFLAHGEIEVRFVGPVLAEQTVEAKVDFEGDSAHVEVTNVTADRTAAVGHARRRAEGFAGNG